MTAELCWDHLDRDVGEPGSIRDLLQLCMMPAGGAERAHLVSNRLRHPGGTREPGGSSGDSGMA